MSKLKVPKSISVGGRKIPIDIRPMKKRLGEFDPDTRRIALDPSVLKTRREFRSVLVHEVLHAALELGGVAGDRISPKAEEQVVNAIEALAAPAIVRIWKL